VLARTRKEVQVEFEQLRELLESHRTLLDKCRNVAPDRIELSALAAMLHSFYTGIENMFARVSLLLKGQKPRGESWHQTLIEIMTAGHPPVGVVLSRELAGELKQYLTFRHMFRHAYTFRLRWPKMRPLVLGSERILNRLETEMNTFFNKLGTLGSTDL
jgi:hypothetical protein